MDMYQKLMNLDIDRLDVDEAIALSAFGRAIEAEYAGFGAEMPDRLKNNLTELRRDVRAKSRALLEKRLREVRNRKQAMLPRDQKIALLAAEEEALLKKLETP